MTKTMSLGPEGRLLGCTQVFGPFCAHWAERTGGSPITMPCFSLLKGLEPRPWLGLCNLFISFQAGLCKLIHGGGGEEAGEATTVQKTNNAGSAAPCPGGGGGCGGSG